jgi:hypothetical protein
MARRTRSSRRRHVDDAACSCCMLHATYALPGGTPCTAV